MKTLYVDPRGCDFFDGVNVHGSDVGNYRLVACILAKNGEPLVIEFGGWVRKDYTKRKPVVIDENALRADGAHTVYSERPGNPFGPDAGCYGFNFERIGVNPDDYHYTRADLLRFASDVAGEEYTDLVFSQEKVDEEIAQIYTPFEKSLYSKARAAHDKIEAERKAAHDVFMANWRATRHA